MTFDAFQREVLAELGHVLYRVAGADPVAVQASDSELSPLLRAVCRAAGVAPTQLPPLPPAAQLMTVAGKRALWPRLRALRARTAGGQ